MTKTATSLAMVLAALTVFTLWTPTLTVPAPAQVAVVTLPTLA